MKTLFLSRQLREKFILLALFGIGFVLWGTHLYGAVGKYRADEITQKANRDKQLAVLGRKDQILAEQRKIIQELDPARSVDSAQELLLVIDNINRAHPGIGGIATGNQQAKVNRGSQLTMITQQVTMNNVPPDMNELVDVYREFARLAPYVTILDSNITYSAGNTGRGRGGAATDFATTAGGAPGQGGRGRGGAATTTAGAIGNETGGRGGAQPRGAQPTATNPRGGPGATGGPRGNAGPRLSVSFTLNAISITKPGAATPPRANAAPAAAAPAAPRSGAAP
jgi:hypothetical protein